jgi:hypothetical protein
MDYHYFWIEYNDPIMPKMEDIMIGSTDVHRHADGSIDFDFYRRRAARQRRLTRRVVARHYLTALGRIGTAVIAAFAMPTISGSHGVKSARTGLSKV